MSIARQINNIIEQMPEQKQALVLKLVKTMISSDEMLTEEDIADIEQARLEYAQGETINHDQINWN